MKKILFISCVALLFFVACQPVQELPPSEEIDFSDSIPIINIVQVGNWFSNDYAYISWSGQTSSIFKYINIYREEPECYEFRLIHTSPAADCSYLDEGAQCTKRPERYYITGITAQGVETAPSDTLSTVHLSIRRGAVEGTYVLTWNAYSDKSLTSYEILRGESNVLYHHVISLSPTATSYFDQKPDASQPCYVVEYQMPYVYRVRSVYTLSPPPEYTAGWSNVVNVNDLSE